MKTVQLSHFALVLAITATVSLVLGFALQDAAPTVVFVSALAVGAFIAVAFRAFEQQR